MKKRISVAMALILAATGAMASTAMASAETEDAKATKDSGIVVGWLQKNQTNYFETVINDGGEALLEQYKKDGTVKEYYLFDGQTDASVQVTQATDMINLGVDVCILQPAEGEGCAPIVDMMNEAGIPVIEVNALTSNADEAAGFAGSDDVNAGEIMGQYIIDTLGDKGGYAHLQGIIGNSAEINRTQGIHNIMDKQSGWEMLDEQTAEWAADKAAQFTNDWLNLYGDKLNAIICDNDDMAVAVRLACLEAGREDIVVIGVDFTDAAAAMIKDGELAASVRQDGTTQGAEAVRKAIALAQGREIVRETYIPFMLITADNIDEYYSG